jgi:ubiquinone/menaquinone biosynthesis C-methylase UbiE
VFLTARRVVVPEIVGRRTGNREQREYTVRPRRGSNQTDCPTQGPADSISGEPTDVTSTEPTTSPESSSRRSPDDPVGDRPKSLDDIRDAYERYADWVARFSWLDRLFTGRHRRRQFARAEGRVLDVACGTGTNFSYLPETVDLVGIDISPAMLEKAAAELDRQGLDGTLRQMDAEALEFDDDSFDTVISALSTCTFPDPVAALREMERVCRPDGRILLLEHGKSDVDVIARYQEWRADAKYATAGCRVTQQPLEIVERAGLNVETSRNAQFGRLTTIEIAPQ